MTLDDFVSRLEPSGSGYVCPAHGDDGYALSVAEGDRRPVIFHCHGGCDAADVLKAMGLRWGDLR